MQQPITGRLIQLPDREGERPRKPAETAVAGNLQQSLGRAHSPWRRWRQWVMSLFVLTAGVAALRLTVLAPKPIPVKATEVTRGVVEETVSNTRAGTVKASRRARLSPETGGRVVAVPHRKGDRVAAGALLLRLDNAMQQAQVDLAREDVRAAAARVDEVCLAADLAGTELRRVLDLKVSGIASDQTVDRMASENDRARAACRAARAALDQSRARQRLMDADLARTTIQAPFLGMIAELNTELGEWITPSPPGILVPSAVEVLDLSSLYVVAPIDEMDAERVKVGQEVRLSVDSRRGEHYRGHLVRIAPYVRDVVEQNRTIEVEAEFDDPRVAESLLPGTSADVEVILSRREGVVQVPTGAIGQGSTVLVVENDRLVEHTVKPGLRNWRSTEVLDGLKEGERVVIARDSASVKPGARVSVGGDK